MNNAKAASTPMPSSTKLDQHLHEKLAYGKTYRGTMGSLLYLTTSRPNIVFSVRLCAHFQLSPKAFHLIAVKLIFRYLAGTKNFRLWYPKEGDSDADYVGYKVDRKSTSLDTCQFLVPSFMALQEAKLNGIINVRSRLHYAGGSYAQLLWIMQQLCDLGINHKVVPIHCDNMSAINITTIRLTLLNKAY